MASQSETNSWDILTELIRAADAKRLEAFLESLSPSETARAVSRLRAEERVQLLHLLSPAEGADLSEELPDAQAVELLGEMVPSEAAAIVEEMPSAERADVLGDLKTSASEAILGKMDPQEAAEARQLLAYPPDTAGGLMITEYLEFPESSRVGDVVGNLRELSETYADYQVQYVYIVSLDGKLIGVLRLRDLLLAPGHASVASVMIKKPLSIRADASLYELTQFFREHAFVGGPVIDQQDRLVGVVRRAAMEAAAGEVASQSFLKVSGIVGGEELRSMPFRRRSIRRLSWLSVNILLNIIAASVIALYQETLSAAIALAVFLPIISDMSGCSGNQAVAVSLRELTLGLVRPQELFRVFSKEVSVGLVNGCVLGLLLSGVTLLWKGNPYLGLVAGGALAINTTLAVALGGLLPLILQRLKIDPAIASGPILTTVTDMCGFFFVLSFASAVLPHLSS
jgi:magnesium transporter